MFHLGTQSGVTTPWLIFCQPWEHMSGLITVIHTFMAHFSRGLMTYSWLISVTCRNTAVWFGYTFMAHYCRPVEHNIGPITNGSFLSCLETDLWFDFTFTAHLCHQYWTTTCHSLAGWCMNHRVSSHFPPLCVKTDFSAACQKFHQIVSSCVLVALFFKVHFKDNLWQVLASLSCIYVWLSECCEICFIADTLCVLWQVLS